MGKLDGKKIAFLVANEGIEQVELTEPRKAVKDAGATPELIAPEPGEAQAFNHLDKADTFTVDTTAADADPSDYDGLVLPGGVANPDNLRTHEDAVAADRSAQRGRELGRRGGRGRPGPRVLAQPRRPSGLLRQDRRGVLRRRPRGPGEERLERVTEPILR